MANLSNINNKFLVTTGGNVGINSTGPNEKLEVGGSIRIDNGASFTSYQVYRDNIKYGDVGSGGNQFTIQASNNKNINLFDDSGVGLTVKDGGNVGIGKTSPNYKLDIEGADLIRAYNPSGSASIQIKASANNNSSVDFADPDDTNVGQIIYRHADNSMSFDTNDIERMRITSTGNIGISGDTSAWALGKTIQINGSYGTINYNSGSGAILGIVNAYFNGSAYIRQNAGYAGSIDYNIAKPGGFAFRTENSTGSAGDTVLLSTKMVIDSSGNVGIGTTNPGSKLDIASTTGPQHKINKKCWNRVLNTILRQCWWTSNFFIL